MCVCVCVFVNPLFPRVSTLPDAFCYQDFFSADFVTAKFDVQISAINRGCKQPTQSCTKEDTHIQWDAIGRTCISYCLPLLVTSRHQMVAGVIS